MIQDGYVDILTSCDVFSDFDYPTFSEAERDRLTLFVVTELIRSSSSCQFWWKFFTLN